MNLTLEVPIDLTGMNKLLLKKMKKRSNKIRNNNMFLEEIEKLTLQNNHSKLSLFLDNTQIKRIKLKETIETIDNINIKKSIEMKNLIIKKSRINQDSKIEGMKSLFKRMKEKKLLKELKDRLDEMSTKQITLLKDREI
jgi:hypothetical protein